ncbi:MAG: sensor histidine kinase [Oligoflexia bacterium]|nr:sensor histidine kinase [Oligoflexia bacterium]
MAPAKKTSLFRHRSLTMTLAVGFFSLCVLVLVIGSILNVVLNFNTQQRLIADRQQLIAQNAANAVRNYIQGKISVLENAITLSNMAHEGIKKKQLVLDKIMGKELSFRQMVLVARQGRELARVSRMSQSLSARLMKENKGIVVTRDIKDISTGSVYVDDITGEPMMLVSLPVKDVFGDYNEILIAEVNLKFMWDVIDSLHVGKGGLAYVVDSHGNLIAFRDISRILKGENLMGLDIVKEWQGQAAGTVTSKVSTGRGIMGTYVVASFERLKTPEWAVIVELPVAEAYKSIIDQIILAAVVLVLCIVLAILFGIWFSKSVTRPIISLCDVVQRVGTGDRSVEIPVETDDEIGKLAASFNQMVSDLRDKEKLHQKYVHAEKLAAIGQIVSGVAHEINNPLSIILGHTQLLIEQAGTDSEFCASLRSIEREIFRCSELLKGLLSFSRMGRSDSIESIDINTAVDEIIKLIEVQTKIKNVNVNKQYASDLPQSVINKNQIQQVILNLCNNAIDAMPDGGSLTVETKAEEGRIEISITDTGVGMKEDVKDHLFEAFFTTKPIGKGTGLGLNLCNEIVKGHNGTINVYSSEGKGTTFNVRLPIV